MERRRKRRKNKGKRGEMTIGKEENIRKEGNGRVEKGRREGK